MLARLSLGDQLEAACQVCEGLSAGGPDDWRRLAAILAVMRRNETGADCPVIGIGGGQGAGKSTLAAMIEAAMEVVDLGVAVLSLDDFYLTRLEREQLGASVHPLLATRGVPGTHDAALACRVIEGLRNGNTQQVPVFDKGIDDRLAESRTVLAPVDVIVFEGWCVGATAEPDRALRQPCNDLERLEDPDGRWRRYVNSRLQTEYAGLWGLIDTFVFLKVPDIDAVLRWRGEQEQARPEAQRMDARELRRFVQHYQRLTLQMNRELPASAHIVGFLDEDHSLADLAAGAGPQAV